MNAREKILSVPGTGEINIFFDENLYLIDINTMSDIAISTVLNGETTGLDLTRAEFGHIKCYYNPTRMDLSRAQKGSRRIINYIASCSTKVEFLDR